MTMPSALGRDDRLVGTLHRRPALRVSDIRPKLRNTALLGMKSLCGDGAYDAHGRFLGDISDIVIDLESGRVAYALVTAHGFLGIGRKWFAIPWRLVTVDRVYQRCVINATLERLIDAPRLDGDPLPRMADAGWATEVHAYFACPPYWA